MLVGIVEGRPQEGTHGPIHNNEVLVAIGLHACDCVDKSACIAYHGTARLQYHGQAQIYYKVPDCVDQICWRRNLVTPASEQMFLLALNLSPSFQACA